MNNDSNHDGHNKMMWLMMLFCIVPSLVVFFFGSGINKGYIILFLLVCVGGHFVVMKIMKHKPNKKNIEKNNNCH